jgi:hypothetical protein
MVTNLPELPNFKASFGSLDWQIPIVLDVIGRRPIRPIRSVNRELYSEFVRCLQGQGRTVAHWSYNKEDYVGQTYTGRKASKKFLIIQIFSLALPGAINLDLISKQENLVMLTFYGTLLHDELTKSGCKTILDDPRAIQIMNRILLELDKKWGILDCIEQLGESADSKGLIKCLHKKGTEIPVSIGQTRRNVMHSMLRELAKRTNGRGGEELLRFTPDTEKAINSRLRTKILNAREASLRQLLGIYSSLGLLNISGEKAHVNKEYMEDLQKGSNFWKTVHQVSKEKFFDSVLSSYGKHSKHQEQNVAIPLIRSDVCRELNIPWEFFDRKFIELGYQFRGYVINLSRGIFRKKWGISVGTANYYYVSLIPR